jgi:hypothetical protein
VLVLLPLSVRFVELLELSVAVELLPLSVALQL